MTINVFNQQFYIDSIEFTGNMLEVFVFLAKDYESTAIPVMTRGEFNQLLFADGYTAEDLEQLDAWDYFDLFKDRILEAIEAHYPAYRKRAKRALYTIIFLILAIHLAAGLLIWYDVWYCPILYIAGMAMVASIAVKNNII